MASTHSDFVTGNTSVGRAVNGTNSSVNVNGTESGFPFYMKPIAFPPILVYMYIILTPIGMLNNSLTLAIFHRMPKKLLYTYLKGLAWVDLLFVCSVGVSAVYMWNGYTSDYVFCFIMCRIVMQLMWVCAKASTCITTLLAVERAIGVFFPFLMMRLNSVTTRVRYVLVVIAIVTLASQINTILVLLPTPYGDSFFCSWSPVTFSPLGLTLRLLNACVFDYVMPLLLLITNICLIIQLPVTRAARRKLQADGKQVMNSSVDHRITTMLICASLLCLVSNTPTTLLRLGKVPDNIYEDIRRFTDFVFVFERTAHFYMYVLMIDDFRRMVKSMVCCKPATDSLPDVVVTGSKQIVSDKYAASEKHAVNINDEKTIAEHHCATDAAVPMTPNSSLNIT